MPMASATTGTPREDLLGAFTEFDPAAAGFIARLVMPPLPVQKRVGTYGKKPMKAYTQAPNTKRAPKARTARGDWTPESATWKLQEFSFEHQIDKVNAELYADWFDAEEEAAVITRQTVDTDLERDVATMLFNRSNFPLTGGILGHDAANPWTDAANGNLVLDLKTAKIAGQRRGIRFDTLVLPAELVHHIPLSNSLFDRIKYVYGGVTELDWTADVLAKLLGFDRVLIPNGHTDSASAELAVSLSEIWTPNMVGLYSTSAGPINTKPCVGRIFEQSDSSGVAIYSYEEPQTKSVVIGAEQHEDPEIMYDQAGYLIGATAA